MSKLIEGSNGQKFENPVNIPSDDYEIVEQHEDFVKVKFTVVPKYNYLRVNKAEATMIFEDSSMGNIIFPGHHLREGDIIDLREAV